MRYKVRVAANAQKEADAAFSWLTEGTIHAVDWLNGLEAAIDGLRQLPNHWPLARESCDFAEPVRQLLYGKSPHVYRVLFIVRKDVVYVLHVRHGARQPIAPGEMNLPPRDKSS